MKKFFEELIRWIRETLPTAVTLGALIFNYMRDKLRREEKAHDKTKLEKELVENELSVEREFSGESDADIIKRASRGQRPAGKNS